MLRSSLFLSNMYRLVAVLAELVQKGGVLRLVGKVALLWGGIRGAMSLTDKLISFLHIADRPLSHRLVVSVHVFLFTSICSNEVSIRDFYEIYEPELST